MKLKFIFQSLILAVAGLVVASLVFAWTNPSGNPPSGGGVLYYFNSKIGVGTANPNYKLDVQGGQINVSGGLCIAGDCKTSWSQVSGVVSAANVFSGQFGANTGGGNYSFPANVGIAGGGTTKPLTIGLDGKFVVNSTGYVGIGIPDPIGRLDVEGSGAILLNSGNVGIGTSYPSAKLDVQGTGGVILNAGNVTIGASGNSRPFIVGSGNLVVDTNGNVGVGNINPAYKLDVQNGQMNASGGLCIAGDCKSAWDQIKNVNVDMALDNTIQSLNATTVSILLTKNVTFRGVRPVLLIATVYYYNGAAAPRNFHTALCDVAGCASFLQESGMTLGIHDYGTFTTSYLIPVSPAGSKTYYIGAWNDNGGSEPTKQWARLSIIEF